jgi:hypothetical protein
MACLHIRVKYKKKLCFMTRCVIDKVFKCCRIICSEFSHITYKWKNYFRKVENHRMTVTRENIVFADCRVYQINIIICDCDPMKKYFNHRIIKHLIFKKLNAILLIDIHILHICESACLRCWYPCHPYFF